MATALFFQHSLFCEILIIAILGQLGDWLRFVYLQDTHFGKVDFVAQVRFGPLWLPLTGAGRGLGLELRGFGAPEVPGPPWTYPALSVSINFGCPFTGAL